jgi:hypothetical protein
MIECIDDYLSQLKKELSGSDLAVIQDALSDAEEHLRTALKSATSNNDTTESEALQRIIEEYGTPEEIATAYREIEDRIPPAFATRVSYSEETKEETEEQTIKDERPLWRRFFAVVLDLRVWGAFLYMLISLITGIFYFTWAVTGISLSAGLMVLIVGLPFAGLFILSIRGLGLVEGRIVEALLGIRMPRRQVFYQRDTRWWIRFKTMLTEKYTWFSLIYMLLQLPLGIIYFTVFITLIAISLYGIALPILQLGFHIPVGYSSDYTYYIAGWLLPFTVIAGILLAVATMHLVKHIGRLHGAYAKALLVRG